MKYLIFSKRGFTLTELIVVIAIATIIMTALVVQQNNWNDRLTVSTQAYELALMIRQAQIYSLGVRENVAGVGNKFNVGYGVFFGQLSSDADPANDWKKRYIFFADKDGNKEYNEGVDNIIETKYFNRNIVIDRFCGVKGVGQFNEVCCPGAPGTGNVSYIHISFFRPEPKANIVIKNNGKGSSNNVIPPAIIYLISPGGKQFSVTTEANGQISVAQI